MKKSIIYILLFFSCFLISCKSTLPIEQENTMILKEIDKRDSIKNVLISKAIKDNLIIPVAPSSTNNRVFDSLVNAKVDEILSKLNSSKTSGDNSWLIYYNALKKQLELQAIIGETKSEKTNVSTQKEKDKNQEIVKPIIVKKPYTLIEKVLMILGLIFGIYFAFKAVFFIKQKIKIPL